MSTTEEDPESENLFPGLNRFCEVMEKNLTFCVTTMPEVYAYPVSEIPAVMGRMRFALMRRSYNKDSPSFKRTCKDLGLRHSYTAINAFINGE